jgi:hypothetical protein
MGRRFTSMIHFIGDTHGKTERLVKIVDHLAPAPTFQLGDMGLGFKGVFLPHLRDTFYFGRGNHDKPSTCREHPNYMGDYGFKEVEGRNMFFCWGAYSIDHEWRRQRMSVTGEELWWPDEEQSPEELEKAVALYKERKPDLVITHEAPQEVARQLLTALIVGGNRDAAYFNSKFGCVESRTASALQQMFVIHQPRNWVFGHYHVDKLLEVKGTNFRCVAELSTYSLDSEASHG